ncbi:MAG: methyltransferase domain-containing protein [Planctomycetes bacterium]|nr:methyltransferase domain-containing protein [Planctomycetota bacterium]
MGLAEEVRRQLAWRSWPQILAALPPLARSTVLDLGCGAGDLSAELVARGARVLGIDGNEELLGAARARGLPGAEFRCADLRSLPDDTPRSDGIWCSFVAAYFPELEAVLRSWSRVLAPGGWIALVEIDDFFAHEPVRERTRELLAAYVEDARRAGRYDFRMGRRLEKGLIEAGFTVQQSFSVPDLELAFDGPARPDVLEAWRLRFERMGLLRSFCGDEHAALVADFLQALAHPEHRSGCRVRVVIGRRSDRGQAPI